MSLPPGASNLFLSTAKDVNEAISMALRFPEQSEVLLPKQGDKSQIWMIVFMGSTSSVPPHWTIERVEYNQSKIRVTYSVESRLGARTRDLHPYFYWIPLQGIQYGKYDLLLRDSATKEIVLSRKVWIKESER